MQNENRRKIQRRVGTIRMQFDLNALNEYERIMRSYILFDPWNFRSAGWCETRRKHYFLRRQNSDVSKYLHMLFEIYFINKSLKSHGCTLTISRDDLYVLIVSVDEVKNTPTSSIYECELCNLYTSEGSSIENDPLFESAVIKIQKITLQAPFGKRKNFC